MGVLQHRRKAFAAGAEPPNISNVVADSTNNPDVNSYVLSSSSNKANYGQVQETGSANTTATWNASESMTQATGSPVSNLNATSQTIDLFYLDSPTATTANFDGDSAETSSIGFAFEISGAATGTPTKVGEYTVDETTSSIVVPVTPTDPDSLLVMIVTHAGAASADLSGNVTGGGTWTTLLEVPSGTNSSYLAIVAIDNNGSTSARDVTIPLGASTTRPTVTVWEYVPA